MYREKILLTIVSLNLILQLSSLLSLKTSPEPEEPSPTPPPPKSKGEVLAPFHEISPTPISEQASIVIEKINVNAPIFFDVNPYEPSEYSEILKKGIAHAKGTVKPGKVGNSFLFAHSSQVPEVLGEFEAVFSHLQELQEGEIINVFLNQQRIDFFVREKKNVLSSDLSLLLADYEKPVLTLQTCDPPGDPQNRLIVIAEMKGRYEI